jgi:hypothetical protein
MKFYCVVIEGTISIALWYDVPCFRLDFPLILIFDTLILSNEIVSSEIMIVPIDNNSSYVSKIKSSFSHVNPSNKS